MATRTSTRTRRTTKKAEPEPEVDEDEDLLEDDDAEEEAPAPKRRTAAKKAPAKKAPAAKPAAKKEAAETLGTAWLKEHVNETLDANHESTKLRIVLRKLIKDGTIESPKDGRYVFTGPRDPNVKAIIAALREEAKAGPTKRGRKPKAKVAAEIDEDDEVEDLDLEDDE